MTLMLAEPMLEIAMPNNGERRRGLRIRQARPIKLFDPSAARFAAGRTCDISADGLRIELPILAPVYAEQIVYVHISESCDGHAQATQKQLVPAKIIWVDRTRRDALTAGIELLTNISVHRDAA
jgi:hypothetical protein